MTEPNFIIFLDLDSGKTALQNCILKIIKNNGLNLKNKRLGHAFRKKIQIYYLVI